MLVKNKNLMKGVFLCVKHNLVFVYLRLCVIIWIVHNVITLSCMFVTIINSYMTEALLVTVNLLINQGCYKIKFVD